MAIQTRFLAAACVIALPLLSQPLYAEPAKSFLVAVPNAATIDGVKDHFRIELTNGWLNSNQDWFSRTFSSAKKAALALDGTVKFTGGNPSIAATSMEIADPKHATDVPLGISNKAVFEDIPSDIPDATVKFNIAIANQDNIAKLLDSVEGAKANLPAEVFSAPYQGYARLVSTITQTLFGTADDKNPIQGQFGLRPTKEQYLLFVGGPDGDNTLRNATDANFSYQGSSLLYRPNSTTAWAPAVGGNRKWSFLLFKVVKVSNPKTVTQRSFGPESATPWGVVISTQLTVLRTSTANDASKLQTIQDAALTALQNLEKFLSVDNSFTTNDRVVALDAYAGSSIATISAACKRNNIADAQCPVTDLQQFQNNLPLPKNTSREAVKAQSSLMQWQVGLAAQMMKDNSVKLKAIPNLGTLSAYLQKNKLPQGPTANAPFKRALQELR